MTTDQLEITWLVSYDVLIRDYASVTDQRVLTGPTNGRPYTDFEDLRQIIALRAGVPVNKILVTGVRMDNKI